MTKLYEYIDNQGGILSGELANYIVKTDNITPSAARKRVERLTSPIHRIKGLFADNQSFLYHSNNFESEEYFQKLEDSFKTSAKRCYSIIVAINYHYGIILKNELPNYSFSPVINIRGHQKCSTLFERLLNARVLCEYDADHYCLSSRFPDFETPDFRHFKAVQFSKSMVIDQFADWSRKIGLTSYNIRETNKEICGFQFAFAAPSYINGLVQYRDSSPKPGFVVADILLGNVSTSVEIDFFIQKISAIRASNPIQRIFPVLIIDSVDTDAFSKLKKNGILIATIHEIFGDNYSDLIQNLINTIVNAGAILKKDPESYIRLMDQLTKLVTGKTNNLRGDLFELAVGYYYGKLCQSLDIGRKIKIENEVKIREIDVLADFENEVRVIECKGYNYPIDDDYVNTYISDRIPLIRKWLNNMYPSKTQIFEIWSTGGFSDNSIEILQKAKLKTKKYQIDFLGKREILERAKQLKTSKFSDILKEYYFKDII